MKQLYLIILFMILWDISLVFIASTGFFPSESTFHGDVGLTEKVSGRVGGSEAVINYLMRERASINLILVSIPVNFITLMTGMLLGTLVLSIFVNNTAIWGLMIVGFVLLDIWTNSSSLLNKAGGLFSGPTYMIFLEIGVGMLMLFLMEVIDIVSGQRVSD
jgi:hypothetical protein